MTIRFKCKRRRINNKYNELNFSILINPDMGTWYCVEYYNIKEIILRCLDDYYFHKTLAFRRKHKFGCDSRITNKNKIRKGRKA